MSAPPSDTMLARYQYDFGDNWRHRIVAELLGAPDLALTLPVCLAGENACPPEDAGGVSGYDRFREELADPESAEPLNYPAWVRGILDPTGFDANASRLRAIR